jgi:glycosyltransferase involved in cell wall biosynthesis
MLRSIFSKPYSRLLIVGDSAGWSIDADAQALKDSADKLGIRAEIVRKTPPNIQQVVHYNSQFALRNKEIFKPKHRISIDYYHGKPDQQESFRECFETLKAHHEEISAVRVSTIEMEGLIKSSGISPEKVVRIPIAVDTEVFYPQAESYKLKARSSLGIPQNAFVIGSFQKDGVGWGEGNEPKLIKGPDIFIKVIEKLKSEVPNLWILLSGPSRGYVKNELKKLGVPYKHEYPKDFRDLTYLYDALDLYIVTSREEGGPKAVLESMSKGVPLVTTEVGQAKDLVKSGVNAMMAPLEDVDKLYEDSLRIMRDISLRDKLISRGFETAKENSHESQLPLWKEYLGKLLDK